MKLNFNDNTNLDNNVVVLILIKYFEFTPINVTT